MDVKIIFTDRAPKPVGPYSQAVVANKFVFVSGQIPIDPETSKVVGETIQEQTNQVLKNLFAIFEKAGVPPNRILKVNVYLKNIGEFDGMNQVYATFFKDHRPARATVEVSNLPKGVKVEIDAIGLQETGS